MIDTQRFFDDRLVQTIGFGFVCAIAGAIIAGGVILATRRYTAKGLATKWFGETQRQVVELTASLSQTKTALDEMGEKMRSIVGYARQRAISETRAAEHFQELADQSTAQKQTKRRTA